MDLAKTSNFSGKLPCFRAFIKFSAKSCKKWDFVEKPSKLIFHDFPGYCGARTAQW